MRFGLAIALLAGLSGLWAVFCISLGGLYLVPAAVFAWTSVSGAFLATAYLGAGPTLLGKQADGKRTRLATALLLPMALILSAARWVLRKWNHDEPNYNQLSETLFVGRIVRFRDLPPGTKTVLDLTSEFLEDRQIPQKVRYLCLPTLDGLSPDSERLHQLLERSDDWPTPIYVHCAAGHGRAALVSTCLHARRTGLGFEEAFAELKACRPRVRLSREQRATGLLLEQRKQQAGGCASRLRAENF